MKKTTLTVLLFAFLTSAFFSYAEESILTEIDEIPEASASTHSHPEDFTRELTPQGVTILQASKSQVEIRSNVRGASVYINNNYKGTTPLIISGLHPGRYKLKLEKHGYETVHTSINVSRGETRSYNINMEKLTGILSFVDVPAGASIYVDSSLKSSTWLRLEAGYHTIKVRKFGFYDATGSIYVRPHSVKNVSVSMTECPFELISFYSNHTRFNPQYDNQAGQVSFTANVTNDGTAKLSIYDAEAQLVYEHDISNFSTWTNTYTWNGRNSLGEMLPDGKYTAYFEAANQKLSATVSIDYSVKLFLRDITSSGTGTGPLLSARSTTGGSFMFSFSTGPEFNIPNGFYSVPLRMGLSWAVSDWCELSSILEADLGLEKIPVIFGASLKMSNQNDLGSSSRICYAASFSYNYTSREVRPPYGCNNSAGLGIAAALGFETPVLYIGGTSQFIFSPVDSRLTKNESLWQNGLILTAFVNSSLNIDLYGAIDSFFENGNTDWMRCIESGLLFKIVLGSSNNTLNLGATSYYFPSAGNSYIGARLGTTFGL